MPVPTPAPLGQEHKEKISARISEQDLQEGFCIYELAYIASQMHKNKVFKAKDDEDAEKIGRAYCRATRTKFIATRPFIVDLEEETEAAIEKGKF